MDPERERELLKRVTELGRQVEELRAMVAAEGRRARSSLRRDLRCPQCAGMVVLHAPRVLDRADAGYREPLCLHQPSSWSHKGVGELEVFLCRQCGFAEWYVIDPGSVPADGKAIREIDGRAGGTPVPYR